MTVGSGRKKRLIIPIETKVREFHGKYLLSLIAAERGFDVILGRQDHLREALQSLGPAIYLDKSISETKIPWFKKFRSLGTAVCAWDEEGLVFFDDETYQKMRFCDEAFDQASLFFAWGDVQSRAMLTKRPEVADKIKVTGNPRFDLLRPEFRSFFDEDVNRIRENFGSIILINTNFSFVNHFQNEDVLRQQLNSYSISSQPGFFEGWTEAQRHAFDAFREMVPLLSERYPDHTILIRPHPSERFDPWNNLAEQYENVVVNADGNVQEWILASKVLVHFNCTTGIEAYFLDVPSIAYPKTPDAAYVQPLPNGLSLQAGAYGDLVRLIDEILTQGSAYPRLRDDSRKSLFAASYMSGMDGRLASERIVDCLLQLDYESVLPQPEPVPQVPLIKQVWRQILKLVRRPDERGQAYLSKKFPGLDRHEMDYNLSRFQQITGRFEGVTIEPVMPQCFRLIAR
ncbi:MAG: hypothetical protein RBS57_18725 [Desulforhabdus sp.]|jgi:surface carbohydrate biosynthesis protein|nr:hypothetical protein [Desulforhabdus sp.]